MSNFFAFLNRMKYINRWGLMRSSQVENIAEHTYQVAMLAHCLAVINNEIFGGNINADKAAVIALYHETSEVITGDLPTPIKYFNPQINSAYKQIEKEAEDKLLASLPDKLRGVFTGFVQPDKKSGEYQLVKFADKISALIKCVEECNAGNNEFIRAKKTIESEIYAIESVEVKYFIDNFLNAYYKTLDELSE